MKSIWIGMVVALLVVVVYGLVMANGASQGDGICITISPNTLVLDCDSDCVTVHTNIPIGFVDCTSLSLEGIAPYLTKADSRGDLVAKFDADEVKAIVTPGQVTLTLTGILADATVFSASDTITVKKK